MKRVIEHPVLGPLQDEKTADIQFNGMEYPALRGETIAAALMANGIKKLRNNEESGSSRGVYCNIGHCFECRVHIKDKGVARACLTPVFDGMEITSTAKGEDEDV